MRSVIESIAGSDIRRACRGIHRSTLQRLAMQSYALESFANDSTDDLRRSRPLGVRRINWTGYCEQRGTGAWHSQIHRKFKTRSTQSRTDLVCDVVECQPDRLPLILGSAAGRLRGFAIAHDVSP